VSGKRAKEEPAEYIYAFELLRHYPSTRSYIFKKPLKTSMGTAMMELFFGSKLKENKR
jgi:hypothetical protein